MPSSTVSCVIPTYTLTEDLEVIEYNCAKGYREYVDELIIVEDGGRRSAALLDIADVYVYHDENLGFTANLNMGWKLATKDFAFLVNSDTFIESGDPQDLCIPGTVTSPLVSGPANNKTKELNGAFFTVPREVLLSRGLLDESMKMYYSDNDYYDRVKDIFQQVHSVAFRHAYGLTTKEVNHWDIESAKAVDLKRYKEKQRKNETR